MCEVDDHETPDEGSSEKMQEWMKDGVVICTLINGLCPGSVKKINTSKMAFKQVIKLIINNYGWMGFKMA